MVPTQPHMSPTQSPSPPAQPLVITQPCTAHKLLTTPDMPMSTLWQTTVYMCLAVAHGTCTATGKYDSNTLATYIITHLLTCTHSPLLMQTPQVTCTLSPPAQPPVTTAATCRQHMHQQLHLILLSFYPHLVTPTSPY
jgi:hypothetical protein